MLKSHAKNTVRYYLLVILLLSFLFFSNDFGLIDVQKTAIVTAVGIDREEDEFIVTTQISLPQASSSGGSSQAVQLVSRAKTVAAALEEINAKTGWYPKLVFCKLVVLGENAAKENVFDALEFFLRDEYLTDDCQVATCRGLAKDVLNASAVVDPSSSAAIAKILSAHAERAGSVRPSNLKDFSIGYFGESRSGLLPVLKTEPQQETITGEKEQASQSSAASQDEGGQADEASSQEKPVFSARETALFVGGKWADTLPAEETFAVNAAVGKLQLASFSVDVNEESCSLVVKRNLPKVELAVGKDGRGELKVRITMIAGVADFSKAQGVTSIKDMGSLPDGTLAAAEKKLTAALISAYERAKGVGCDLFGVRERLIKYKRKKYAVYQDTLFSNTALSVNVSFESVR